MLLKNFTNYFTLNYDPFLYLLLLKFKEDDEEDTNKSSALAFQNTSLFQEMELNQTQNNIYENIQQARESGNIDISIGSDTSTIELKTTRKAEFKRIIELYSKKQDKHWDSKDIKEVCNKIWDKENNRKMLTVSDGFQGELFQEEHKLQNLYFLHGAFHITKNEKVIQKITAKQNKAFVEKLEEAIHNEDKDIICVLTNDSDEKKKQIESNTYLSKCFSDLSKLSGSLVIMGSSLAENDQHIFDQINSSSISRIYISSCDKNKKEDFQKSLELFKEKKIFLFDYMTISYSEK